MWPSDSRIDVKFGMLAFEGERGELKYPEKTLQAGTRTYNQ